MASSLTQGTWSSSTMGGLAGTVLLVATAGGTCTVTIADGNGQSQVVTVSALASGTMVELMPTLHNVGSDSIALGPDGNVWVGEPNGFPDGGYLAKITPSGVVTEYNLGLPNQGNPNIVNAIATGSDGNLWLNVYSVGFYKISTGGSILSTYAEPAFYSSNNAIASGADGNLYVFGANSEVYRLSTSGVLTTVCQMTNGEESITTSLNGSTIYMVSGGAVGDLTTSTPANGAAACPLDANANGNWSNGVASNNPFYGGATATTSDGSLWFLINNIATGEYEIAQWGSWSAYPTTMQAPKAIVAGPDGNIWLAGTFNGQPAIERRTTNQQGDTLFTKTSTGSALSSTPVAIVVGSDGNLWFVESGGKVGYISP